ncbi:MAG: secondary thiamine-phosphate synthase enzyme YjbQ [Promethearchaeota archaeon]
MIVYSMRKRYHTKKHFGMIDVTEDFKEAISKSGVKNGIINAFTTGGVAALTTLEFEPGLVNTDLREAFERIAPYLDEKGNVIHYDHHNTWHDDNGSSHIKSAILSPFITAPIIDGQLVIGPWQNFTLVECDTRDREREIVFQVLGE